MEKVGFAVKPRKITIYNIAITVLAILYGILGLFQYRKSLLIFLDDPFMFKKISNISMGLNKYIDIAFMNANIFLSLLTFVSFIVLSTSILFKITQMHISKYLFISKIAFVYLIFNIIFDLYYLPITGADLKYVIRAPNVFLKATHFLKYFRYIIFLPIILFLSNYMKKRN